jgi:hypothetical protein
MDLASAALGESVADEAERDADDEEREPGSVVIHQASNRNWRPSAVQPCPVREDLPIHAGQLGDWLHYPSGSRATFAGTRPKRPARAYLDLLFGVKSTA